MAAFCVEERVERNARECGFRSPSQSLDGIFVSSITHATLTKRNRRLSFQRIELVRGIANVRPGMHESTHENTNEDERDLLSFEMRVLPSPRRRKKTNKAMGDRKFPSYILPTG
eukprot:scaffold1483_cov374-Pavlova_lutheri.AAC.8